MSFCGPEQESEELCSLSREIDDGYKELWQAKVSADSAYHLRFRELEVGHRILFQNQDSELEVRSSLIRVSKYFA